MDGRDTIFEKKKNKKFNFITSGYNLRPTDIQAAIIITSIRD